MPEPPARKVYLHPGADAELAEAVRYYEEEEKGLGAHFEAEIVRCAQLIQRAPESAHPSPPGFRSSRDTSSPRLPPNQKARRASTL